MTQTTSPFEALVEDVDARFDAIRRRSSGRMECGNGCTDCCRCRLSVTRVEEAHIRRGVAGLPLSTRRQLRERADAPSSEMCPALDAHGRCQIYPWRPLACRSQGAPLRRRHPVPLIHPSQIDVCDKNFKNVALGSLADDDVIDHTSLSAKLDAIDPDGRHQRVPLAQILADCV